MMSLPAVVVGRRILYTNLFRHIYINPKNISVTCAARPPPTLRHIAIDVGIFLGFHIIIFDTHMIWKKENIFVLKLDYAYNLKLDKLTQRGERRGAWIKNRTSLRT